MAVEQVALVDSPKKKEKVEKVVMEGKYVCASIGHASSQKEIAVS